MTAHSWSWRFGVRLALALAPAMLVFGSVFAHPVTDARDAVSRVEGQQPAAPAGAPPPQAANMTGKGGFVDSSDLRVSRLKMEAGARTYWHTHPAAQIIVAEEGQGLYQEKGSPVKKFVPGQAIFLKANLAHWHGASPTTGVTQATMYAGAPTWLAAVSDEEYGGKTKR